MKQGNGNYPARVEAFHGLQVTFYDIGGKEFLTSEDIGLCLGLAEPRKTVNKIFNRNRDELESHKAVVNLTTTGGIKETIVFSETGANLIGMFSRSPKSRDFRLWLARLPRRVKALVNGEAVRQAFVRGVEEGSLAARRQLLFFTGGLNKDLVEEVAFLYWLRQRGLTQQEAARLLGKNRDQVQQLEYRLQGMGLTIPVVRAERRKLEMRRAFFEALGWREEETPESLTVRLGAGGRTREPKPKALPAPEPAHDAPAG